MNSAIIVNHRVLLAGSKGHSSAGSSKILYIANRPGAVTLKTADDLRIEQENERMKLLGYTEFRPGSVSERNNGHALFDQTGIPSRSLIQDELKQTQGAVITSVVSVRREDAARLGLSTKQDWERLARSQWQQHIEELGVIAPENIRWTAAMHINDTSYHIHVFTWDKSGAFNSLIPKQELIKAQNNFVEKVTFKQTEDLRFSLRLSLKENRQDLINSFKEMLGSSEKQLLRECLPNKGSLKYGSLLKQNPHVAEQIDRVVERSLRQNPNLQKTLSDYQKLIEKQLDIKSLKGSEAIAYRNAVKHDLEIRLCNAAISVAREDPPKQYSEYKPQVFVTSESSTPILRKQDTALTEELNAFLKKDEQLNLKTAIQKESYQEAFHLANKLPSFRESFTKNKDLHNRILNNNSDFLKNIFSETKMIFQSNPRLSDLSPRKELEKLGQSIRIVCQRISESIKDQVQTLKATFSNIPTLRK